MDDGHESPRDRLVIERIPAQARGVFLQSSGEGTERIDCGVPGEVQPGKPNVVSVMEGFRRKSAVLERFQELSVVHFRLLFEALRPAGWDSRRR